MVATTHEAGSSRFSTNDLPARDRVPFWREVLGRSIAKLDIAPLGDDPFLFEATWCRLPGLMVMSSVGSPYTTTRTRELIASDDRDDIILVTGEGSFFATQRDREATGAPGAGVLIHNARPGVVNFLAGARRRGITVPRAALAAMVADLDAALIAPIPPDNEAMRLLGGYLDLLNTGAAPTSPEVCRLFVAQVYDLVAVMIGATRDAAEIANGRGVRAARLRAIRVDIAENLGGDVRVAALAARHGVSPRYVHRLFESEGTTLSRFVLGRRLACVHRMLSDPRYADLTIGAIAYRAGFSDLSTFNREFRRHYGATPSDVRAAARN